VATTILVDPDGVRPRIWFQPVPESKVVKNRVHLNLGVSGGAGSRWPVPARPACGCCRRRPWTHYVVVMADPEGNEFCLT
jgi:Glyoxalase-like domain